MQKNDLKTGMVVELKNGDKFMFIKNNLVNCRGYVELNSYSHDLTVMNNAEWDYSIIKVYEADDTYKLCENYWNEMPCIWEREKVDWSKVPVDTKVLVKGNIEDVWIPRYFAKYEYGQVFVWREGTTSWSCQNKRVANWNYTKLYEEENEDE